MLKNNYFCLKLRFMGKRKSSASGSFRFKYLVALLFILAGVLLIARNMGWISVPVFQTLVSWKMLLVILGLFTLLRRHYLSGIILLLIGGRYVLSELQLIQVDLSNWILPVVFILAGIILFVKALPSRSSGDGIQTGDPTQYRSSDGYYHLKNSFSGVRQVVSDPVFRGASIANFCGGAVLDLRYTQLKKGETYIDVNSEWGGIQILAPSHWKINIRVDTFIGGSEDKRVPHREVDPESVLVIRGKLSFSGIEIKN